MYHVPLTCHTISSSIIPKPVTQPQTASQYPHVVAWLLCLYSLYTQITQPSHTYPQWPQFWLKWLCLDLSRSGSGTVDILVLELLFVRQESFYKQEMVDTSNSSSWLWVCFTYNSGENSWTAIRRPHVCTTYVFEISGLLLVHNTLAKAAFPSRQFVLQWNIT